jgi:uncharacterized membrane protein YciS (DUF1049 family)
MITLILFVAALLALAALVFILGFRLGGEHWRSELVQVRLEAARARRQLHELTRQAFVAMAEEAQSRIPRRHGLGRSNS